MTFSLQRNRLVKEELMSDPIETAAWWLSWIETGKIIAALLVAIGVAGEFLGDFLAKPLERKLEAARQAELVQLRKETAEANQKAETERLTRLKIEEKLA